MMKQNLIPIEAILRIKEAKNKHKTTLYLMNLGLLSLPEELWELTNLRGLDLSGNKIGELPEQIGLLTNLRGLSLSRNQISNIPKQIGQLTNLQELSLRGNQISELPKQVELLTNLEWLYLRENQISKLPEQLGLLTNLRGLYLRKNQISELPEQIRKLTNLQRLDLSENLISNLPKQIGQLTNLRVLDLSGNKIRELPEQIGLLTNLRGLYLRKNQISKLPEQIGQLTNLQRLDLSENKISELPEQIGQLTNLQWFYLRKNKISELTEQIGLLTNLQELDLSENLISDLPKQIGQLTNLQILNITNNPNFILTHPEIANMGTSAILNHLRSLSEGKARRYEAKLLILGDANEGKTCVSRALRDLPFEHQPTTKGVDIEPWHFKHPDEPENSKKKITLNIWDFEGQEINHQSHQFFLTGRSLYLLVFKGRELFDKDRIEYWLDTIRSRAPNCEVVLVATECEERIPSVPIGEMRSKYPGILKEEKCLFLVGCANNKGVEDLKKHIKNKAAKLKLVGTYWPDSYIKAEKRTKKKAKEIEHINREELYNIFNLCKIDCERYESIARIFGDLGIITHFPDCLELKDFVVLKPQWLTKAISYILENPELAKNQGQITHNRLYELWEKEYRGLSETLHKCAREFELCYDLEYKSKKLSLFPLRFGYEKPVIPWSDIPNSKERRVEYRFDITPPAGIMSRFIVKVHHMIATSDEKPIGVYWYNGVFVRQGNHNAKWRSEGLCEFDKEKRELTITVRAAYPQELLNQLSGFANAVFDFFEGLSPMLYYGCVKIEDSKEQLCKGFHSREDIYFELSQDNPYPLSCSKGKHRIDPHYLISGIISAGIPEKLKEAVKAGVTEGIELIKGDVLSLAEIASEILEKIGEIRKNDEELTAAFGQMIKSEFRNYLISFNDLLDNRDFNSAPAIISISPKDKSNFNPENWFQKEYQLIPYCEFEGVEHKCVDAKVTFRMPKEWWKKTAPKLAAGIKVLSIGLQIAFAYFPMKVNPELYEEMKYEVGFMKELTKHLELEDGAESDISEFGEETVYELKKISKIVDLRQKDFMDKNRILRQQLAELLSEIAPKKYKSRQWGTMQRVPMRDNTFRWLCVKHYNQYKGIQ